MLIAEDDPAIRKLLARKLERAGLRVSIARDGSAALASARAEPPDLIVSDWNMPRVDGLDFVTQVSADPAIGDPPVIMLTARQFDVTQQMLEGTNVREVIRKPFSSKKLIDAVTQLIGLNDGCREAA